MYRKPLVPDDFIVPSFFKANQFLLRPLTIDDAGLDYQAILSSVDAQGKSDAPIKLTRKQNLIDLGWHQKEFQKRSSFSYTILSPNGKQCLGCIYVYPSTKREHDAEVSMWITAQAYRDGLFPVLQKTIKSWLGSKWPFRKVYYHGSLGP